MSPITDPISDWPLPELTGPRAVDFGRYEVQKPWPVDTHMQGGQRGIVLVGTSSYRTAYFEAFPTSPDTFIRGEGDSIEAAEEQAWQKYQGYVADGHEHEFETRGRMDGSGDCKHCGVDVSGVFDLQELGAVCVVCGDDMFASVGDRMYCLNLDPPIRLILGRSFGFE